MAFQISKTYCNIYSYWVNLWKCIENIILKDQHDNMNLITQLLVGYVDGCWNVLKTPVPCTEYIFY